MSCCYQIAVRSDQGRVRHDNRDQVSAQNIPLPDGSSVLLCLLADGFGEACAADETSGMIAALMATHLTHCWSRPPLPNDDIWLHVLHSAAHNVVRTQRTTIRAYEERDGVGASLVLALLVANRLSLAALGTASAYRICGNAAIRLTPEHPLLVATQATIEAGIYDVRRNVLFRTIGTCPEISVATCSMPLAKGDAVVLCSDGLVMYASSADIAYVVQAHHNPADVCATLIGLANERGGHDSVGVAVIRCRSIGDECDRDLFVR